MKKDFNHNEKRKLISTHVEVTPKTASASSKLLALTNIVLFKLNLLQLLILIYLGFQKDIFVLATGYLPPLSHIIWYYLLATSLIFLRMFLIFLTEQLRNYIADLAALHEKKKKQIFLSLAVFNFLTSFFNLPLISLFYAYLQKKEILVQNWFFGTFGRYLSADEQKTSFKPF